MSERRLPLSNHTNPTVHASRSVSPSKSSWLSEEAAQAKARQVAESARTCTTMPNTKVTPLAVSRTGSP